CRAFADQGSKHCAGCPHWGKIKGPLHLINEAIACEAPPLVPVLAPPADAADHADANRTAFGRSMGAEAPKYEAVNREALSRARAEAINPDLKQMNEEYSAGSVAGKFRVMRWMPDPNYPFQRTCEFQTKQDFCNNTVNPKIEVPKFDKK